jgi:hypothetical protein
MSPLSDAFGFCGPSVGPTPPGPASMALAARLRSVESRNVTFLSEAFPVFWSEAKGANVRDADGNVYLDLTGWSVSPPWLPGRVPAACWPRADRRPWRSL